MDTQVEKEPMLTDLAFALPRMVAHNLRAVLRPGTTRVGREGIDVPPMSEDWIVQSRTDADKHGV